LKCQKGGERDNEIETYRVRVIERGTETQRETQREPQRETQRERQRKMNAQEREKQDLRGKSAVKERNLKTF
jgi:hypothetical protein